MPLDIENYTNILIELNKAVKMHNFYPAGHPNLETALQNCFDLLTKEVNVNGEMEWRVDQKGFYKDKNPIAQGNKELTGLARKFFFRKIKEVTITQRVTREELKYFLDILDRDPEELRAGGGAEAYMADGDVNGILLNEMRYEDLKKLKKELEERKKEEAALAEEMKQVEAAPGEAREEEEQPPPLPEQEAAEEEPFDVLLKRLAIETDQLKYNDLAVRVAEAGAQIKAGNRYDELFPALSIFLRHASPASNLPLEIRNVALEKLDGFVRDTDVIRYLTHRAGRKDEEKRAEVQKMLFRAGDAAVEIILDALVDAPEASIRRNLFNTVVKFKDRILTHIELRLRSNQWYVVRQMLAILGELGDPATLDLVTGSYSNEDARVKREVLKSLARIPSPRSTAFLVRTLSDEDMSLRTQAIISLGMLRDPSAVEKLAEVALKWEPFADKQDPVKEAIKALGIIGDRSAVPHLVKVLNRRKWFGKKANEDLRVLAANSLGIIGGDEAIKAIEEAAENSTGDLYSSCKRILEGREKMA